MTRSGGSSEFFRVLALSATVIAIAGAVYALTHPWICSRGPLTGCLTPLWPSGDYARWVGTRVALNWLSAVIVTGSLTALGTLWPSRRGPVIAVALGLAISLTVSVFATYSIYHRFLAQTTSVCGYVRLAADYGMISSVGRVPCSPNKMVDYALAASFATSLVAVFAVTCEAIEYFSARQEQRSVVPR